MEPTDQISKRFTTSQQPMQALIGSCNVFIASNLLLEIVNDTVTVSTGMSNNLTEY